jgi:hypothetical protein
MVDGHHVEEGRHLRKPPLEQVGLHAERAPLRAGEDGLAAGGGLEDLLARDHPAGAHPVIGLGVHGAGHARLGLQGVPEGAGAAGEARAGLRGGGGRAGVLGAQAAERGCKCFWPMVPQPYGVGLPTRHSHVGLVAGLQEKCGATGAGAGRGVGSAKGCVARATRRLGGPRNRLIGQPRHAILAAPEPKLCEHKTPCFPAPQIAGWLTRQRSSGWPLREAPPGCA